MPADPMSPEVRIVSCARSRVRPLVESVTWPDAAPPSVESLAARVAEVPEAWAWTLSGGEPTLRSDLPALIRALAEAGAARPGLATDGLALTRDSTVAPLIDAGLARVRIPLHSARADANDWLSGSAGATRRVRRTIETCAKAGLLVAVDCVVTRPGMSLVEEVVLLAAALGAREVHLHRPHLSGPMLDEAVTLSPRLGILQPWLESAANTARRRGLQVRLHGFPRCAAPSRPELHAPRAAERWLLPAGAEWQAAAAALEPALTRGCPDCPQTCGGAPADYIALFGRTEFDSQGSAGEPEDLDEGGRVRVPAPRAGWTPATRVSAARQRATSGRPRTPAGESVGRLVLDLDPNASTREARLVLVRAAQQRPRHLRLLGGWLAHPKAAALLAETRYFDADVEVLGEVDGLAALPDRALTRLGRLELVLAVLRGPDAPSHDARVGRPGAFDATLALLGRLRAAGIRSRLIADPVDGVARNAFEAAWARGALPGEPAWLHEEPRATPFP